MKKFMTKDKKDTFLFIFADGKTAKNIHYLFFTRLLTF